MIKMIKSPKLINCRLISPMSNYKRLKIKDSKLKSVLLRVNLIIVNLPIKDSKEKSKISPMEKEELKMLLENAKLPFLEIMIREMLLWLNRSDYSVILLINALLWEIEVQIMVGLLVDLSEPMVLMVLMEIMVLSVPMELTVLSEPMVLMVPSEPMESMEVISD